MSRGECVRYFHSPESTGSVSQKRPRPLKKKGVNRDPALRQHRGHIPKRSGAARPVTLH